MTDTTIDTQEILGSTSASNIERRNNTMLALAKAGRTFDDIGARFNLTRARVQQILSSMGFDRTSDIKETHSKILSLASAGKTVGEIATELDKTFDYVDHYCRQNRLKVPRKSRVVSVEGGATVLRKRPSDILPDVRAGVARGKTTSQIATDLNQPYHTVYTLRRRHSF